MTELGKFFKIKETLRTIGPTRTWGPYDRKVIDATIYSSTSDGHGMIVIFEQKEGENILPIEWGKFSNLNNLKEQDFYTSTSA